MESRSQFSEINGNNTQVLIINFGEENRELALSTLARLRGKNIRTELYPDPAKMKKQMSYANKNAIPLVIIAGSKELETDSITIKKMISGEQSTSTLGDLLLAISASLN